MRATLVLSFALLTLPSIAPAQAETATVLPRPEIGIRGGFSHVSEDTDFGSQSYTLIGLPNAIPFSPGGIHVTFFTSPRLALEPQLGLVRISSDGDSFTLWTLGAQGNYFFAPDATRAPYVFLHAATMRESESGSDDNSQNAFGGGLGFRRVHRESIAMRYELRYRRWSSEFSKSNEISFLIGVGAVIR